MGKEKKLGIVIGTKGGIVIGTKVGIVIGTKRGIVIGTRKGIVIGTRRGIVIGIRRGIGIRIEIEKGTERGIEIRKKVVGMAKIEKGIKTVNVKKKRRKDLEAALETKRD